MQCSAVAYLPILTFTFLFLGEMDVGWGDIMDACGVGLCQTGIKCSTADEELGSRLARVSSYIAFARFSVFLLGVCSRRKKVRLENEWLEIDGFHFGIEPRVCREGGMFSGLVVWDVLRAYIYGLEGKVLDFCFRFSIYWVWSQVLDTVWLHGGLGWAL